MESVYTPTFQLQFLVYRSEDFPKAVAAPYLDGSSPESYHYLLHPKVLDKH